MDPLEPKTFQRDKLIGNANIFGRKLSLGMEPLLEYCLIVVLAGRRGSRHKEGSIQTPEAFPVGRLQNSKKNPTETLVAFI